MKISARNVFAGKIAAVRSGAVNAEVEIVTDGGDRIVAIVTEGSVKALGLAPGVRANAYVKAPWVTLLTGAADVRFSARNQLAGTVGGLQKGAVNTAVALRLAGGSVVHAVITNEAADELGLADGVAATALIKASHVIVGVPV
ncbi:MAG: TOBE domain-containing protein [Rhodocyclaceae bacterium]|nr:TOBE domain-containing protein [Rhodocyclaceae bacterium]